MKLKVNGLSASYHKKKILDDISFSPEKGSITAIIGRNGAGKSTLINCINGTKRDYLGEISIENTPSKELSAKDLSRIIACLPQDIPAPHIRVKELVAFGRTPYLSLNGRLTAEDTKAVENAISLVKMEEFSNSFVDRLSGGERKKAFFAMILAQDTPLVILDEPTAHLDAASRFEFLEMIVALKDKTDKTFVVVMHELSEILRYADRIIALDNTKIVFDGTAEDCITKEIPQKYFGVKVVGTKEEGYALLPII